ncbi:probable acyl-CoA dehydrogenase IBR3 isoform X1 [Selaginella moellendorffii]|uniref:probable acyl-CoA dehydrogenase IBR3 isoform X1 n=1 Tax=Selaginella moellendorffii TaxID=88036 RepID=UPI000D1CFA06|nr:probable acyl-CoA dehydrogenase IBR3 isoform X1 [Selaginella moellendorffii]|eukprot:XP_024538485.1 probable acyl-CoA dehydrogenase IBR3 isoform X1 [Selaginella moellendorffii]
MASMTSDMIESVQEAHRLDEISLLDYLHRSVEGFPPRPAKLTVSQFGHGQSNPTYRLKAEGGNAVKFYVLRKKPPGKLLQSAHAVEREYQVLAALGKEGTVPVPRVFCLCNDPSVIGTPFYVMDYVEGRVFLDPGLKSVKPEERKEVYQAMAKTLAAIHKIDVDRVGLGKFGRLENYCKRQIERWASQYAASTAEGKPPADPSMLKLTRWLRSNVPAEDARRDCGGIVHGDYKIDNLVFHPTEARVLAVLDWELSTLGNRMSDVAYNCMQPYVIDNVKSGGPGYYGFDKGAPSDGLPTQEEFVATYCAEGGASWPGPNWKFYLALSLFRLAAISAGVYNRFLLGNASGGKRAESSGKFACYLASCALELINGGPIISDVPPSFAKIGNKHPGLSPSSRVLRLKEQLATFMEKYIYPNEELLSAHAKTEKRWTVHPLQEELKHRAQAEGLWNLWIPADSAAMASKILFDTDDAQNFDRLVGAGLSNLEYGHLCEIMGRSVWAPEVFNCSAPDTGNMEVLLRYGSPEQQKTWLKPLLKGEIRSAFAMTEPNVASSDATNIECKITRDGEHYIINGRKWWTSGAMDPRCRILIVMGKTDVNALLHKQQSMILVDIKTPGVEIIRPLTVFGYDDAPHGHAEVLFKDVKVPATNILWAEGRGFEIAQGRLGPGRLHHCMRLIGSAERALELMVHRALQRKVFGKLIAQQGAFSSEVSQCRLEITQTRLLVLHAANELDNHGAKVARGALAMAKVAAPRVALKVLDSAIQVHGGAGVSSDTVLAHLWAAARTLRIADGPDDVHLQTIARLELKRARM